MISLTHTLKIYKIRYSNSGRPFKTTSNEYLFYSTTGFDNFFGFLVINYAYSTEISPKGDKKQMTDKDSLKKYILDNLIQFPMVTIGASIANVSAEDYIDRFFEVYEKSPNIIIKAINKPKDYTT